MNVSELIVALQKLDPELDVFVCHPAQCCCGECFLPPDEYSEVSDVRETTARCDHPTKTGLMVVINE